MTAKQPALATATSMCAARGCCCAALQRRRKGTRCRGLAATSQRLWVGRMRCQITSDATTTPHPSSGAGSLRRGDISLQPLWRCCFAAAGVGLHGCSSRGLPRPGVPGLWGDAARSGCALAHAPCTLPCCMHAGCLAAQRDPLLRPRCHLTAALGWTYALPDHLRCNHYPAPIQWCGVTKARRHLPITTSSACTPCTPALPARPARPPTRLLPSPPPPLQAPLWS